MYNLELSEQMIQVIAMALGEAPYRVANPVIAEIQKQIDRQNKEKKTDG